MPDHDIALNSGTFDKLRAIIHKNTGITIAENRKNLLESRLRSRLREIEETSFTGYLDRLGGDADEMQELINRVTTNETYCFRTPRIWEFLEDDFLPEVREHARGRPMRAWSAAASTGEEAHTIGIFCEDFRRKNSGFDYSILGTDISSRVLAKAEKGLYVGKSIARLQKDRSDLFDNYMTGNKEDGFKVRAEIKSRISFKLHNLVKPLSGGPMFDIVFLRNVLIYFSAQEQEEILFQASRRMHPHAALIIGESESLTRLQTPFEQVAPLIYRFPAEPTQ